MSSSFPLFYLQPVFKANIRVAIPTVVYLMRMPIVKGGLIKVLLFSLQKPVFNMRCYNFLF